MLVVGLVGLRRADSGIGRFSAFLLDAEWLEFVLLVRADDLDGGRASVENFDALAAGVLLLAAAGAVDAVRAAHTAIHQGHCVRWLRGVVRPAVGTRADRRLAGSRALAQLYEGVRLHLP